MTDVTAKTAATKVKALNSAAATVVPAAIGAVSAATAQRSKADAARAAKVSQPMPVASTKPAEMPAPEAIPATIEPAAAMAATTATEDNTMTDMNRTADTMTDKAQAVFADAKQRAESTMEKGQKVAGEMTDFTKGNVEAIVESAKIAARGFETMGQDVATYAKQSFERTSATVRQLASVKSPTELMKLQSDFARTSFDAMVAEGSRSTEAMLKLVGEVVQPISNRFALAAEKVKAAA